MARQDFHGRENAGEKGEVGGDAMRHRPRKTDSTEEVNKPRGSRDEQKWVNSSYRS